MILGRLEVGEVYDAAAERLEEDELFLRSRKRLAGDGELCGGAVNEQLRGQEPAAVAQSHPRLQAVALRCRRAFSRGVEA